MRYMSFICHPALFMQSERTQAAFFASIGCCSLHLYTGTKGQTVSRLNPNQDLISAVEGICKTCGSEPKQILAVFAQQNKGRRLCWLFRCILWHRILWCTACWP